MSVSMPLKLPSLMKINKWKTWRIVNSIVIFLSFFAPFVVMDWGGQRDLSKALIATGFKTLDYYGRLGLSFLTESSLPSHTGRALLIYWFLGLATILIYSALNLLLAMFSSKLIDKPVWTISVFCLIVLGLRSLWYIPALDAGWGALSNTLLGYWLIMIGLASSTVLEISYFLSKRI